MAKANISSDGTQFTNIPPESKDIKFTGDELKDLQELQTKYQETQSMLGQLAVQKILLNQQIDALNIRTEEVKTQYQTVQQEERELVKTLNDKYGPGQLDPATGVFTPST